MSTVPIATMTRRVVQLADGTVQYEVTTQISDPGDLPFPELFLVNITDPSSEKSDVLARVVTPFELREITDVIYVRVDSSQLTYISGDPFAAVADVVSLTQFARDRTTALRRGSTQYLTSVVTLSYTTITAAVAAYQTLLARLSTLTTDWRTFRDSFVTDPTTGYPLPQVSAGVENALIASYTNLKKSRVAAQATRDTLQAQKDACSQQDSANNAIQTLLLQDIAFLQAAAQYVRGINEAAAGFSITPTPPVALTPTPVPGSSNYQTILGGSGTTKDFVLNGSDARSYAALLNTKLAALATLQAAITAHDATCEAITRQLADAQVAVAAAQTAENVSLSALLAVCPTFNSATVTV